MTHAVYSPVSGESPVLPEPPGPAAPRPVDTERVADLIRRLLAALGEDPAGARAQALAARWRTLVEGFTGGDPEIQKGLNTMWADKENWPAEERARFTIKPEIQTFITEALRRAQR